MKDKKTKQHYTAPEVTVVSFVAERGFQSSQQPLPPINQAARQDYIYNNDETHNQIW